MIILLLLIFSVVILILLFADDLQILAIVKRYKKHQNNPYGLKIVNFTFNQFEKIVNVNPSRWFFDFSCIKTSALDNLRKDVYKEFKSCPHAFYYKCDKFTTYRIIFSSFFDYIKFERWLKRYEKEGERIQKIKEEAQINKNLENLLESVKTDINKLQEEANEEIKKSLII